MGQHNIIELNGKQYDAVTGAIIGQGHAKADVRNASAPAHRGGRTIDGFVRMPKGVSPAPTIVKPSAPKPATPVAAAQPKQRGKSLDVARAPHAIKPHQPERPKTLMRHAVSKPKTTMKPAIKTAAPSEIMAKPVSSIAKPLEKKMSVTQVNPHRLARARHVERSQHIHRFNQSKRQAAQERAQTAARTAAVAASHKPAAVPIARPTVKNASHSPVLAQTKQQLASQQHKVDIFEAALAHAVSHEQMPQQHVKHSRSHRRLVNVLAGIGAFLVLGGFLAYLNMPAIELQVASMRAGFHAELPGYSPTGYALDGGIKSSNGQISMKYTSGSSSYLVTQEQSDWNSATLLDQESVQHGDPTQTIQSKGRIIYIYDENSASWVNGGVRYQIHGNNALDADELVSVATSL